MINTQPQLYLLKNYPLETPPNRATSDSLGIDLYVAEDIVIKPGSVHYVKTGVTFGFTNKFPALLMPRSSLCKKGLIMGNSIGLIDADYRGEIMLPLISLGWTQSITVANTSISGNTNTYPSTLEYKPENDPNVVVLKKGDKVAQLVFLDNPSFLTKYAIPQYTLYRYPEGPEDIPDQVSLTTNVTRGSGGFGSTGK